MFKLNNPLNNLKYSKQGKLVQELKDLQERKELVNKEISKNKCFPCCTYKVCKQYPYIDKQIGMLGDTISKLWLGKIDYCEFNSILKRLYNFDNAIGYFEELGKYFINLSGNIETIQRLNNELKELEEREKELKDKLEIK